MIYLDTSAIVKLIRQEAESDALYSWLDEQPTVNIMTSQLAEVELPRALRARDSMRLAAVASVLAHMNRYAIDDAVRATAGAYPHRQLRSLDAIHLATADQLVTSGKTLTAFVTYDRKLQAVAKGIGMTTAAPGQA